MLITIKAAISLCVAVVLISCVSIDPIDPQNEYPTQPAVVTDSNETTTQEPLKTTPGAVEAKTEEEKKAEKAAAVLNTAGTVLVAALAIAEITNIVKEKVVPIVLTLVFVGVVVSTVIHTDPKAE